MVGMWRVGEAPARPIAVHPDDGCETYLPIPRFSWEPAFDPNPESMPSYVIQIARDAAFRTLVDEDQLPAVVNYYVPDKELPPGDYWWRLAGVTAAGERRPWLVARKLKVRMPARTFRVPPGATFNDIQQVLREASKGTPARVLFAGGEYRLHPSGPSVLFDLAGAADLILDGNGSSVVLTRPSAIAHFARCRRVLLKGFVFDFDPPAYTAGRITTVDSAAGSIEVEILAGHSLPDEFPIYDQDRKGMVVSEDDGYAIKRGIRLVISHAGFRRIAGRRFRFRLQDPKTAAQFAPGDIYILDPRWNSEGGGATVQVTGGEDVVLYDLVIRGAPNECLNSYYADYHAILHTRIERGPGRALSANNGGNNHHNARHGPWIEGCLFENTGDDICHVNSLVMSVEAQPAPARVLLRLHQPFDPVADAELDTRPGDWLEFFDRAGGKLLARRRVVSVERSGGNLALTLDGPVAGLVTGSIRPSRVGEQLVSDRSTTQVFNVSRGCNQFVFRHNTCRNGRRVGVLAKGRGGLIEDNSFTKMGGGGVEFWNAPFEGLGAVDYVVRNNRIDRCGRLAREHAAIWATIFKTGGSRLHRNLLVTGNDISGFTGPPILLRDAENVVVRGNRISACDPAHEPVTLVNTAGVSVRDNPVANPQTP